RPEARRPIEMPDKRRAVGLTATIQNRPSRRFDLPWRPSWVQSLGAGSDQSAAPGFDALPLNSAGAGIRLSSPAIVLPSYFPVIVASTSEVPSAAAVRNSSLLSLSPAE